MAEVVRSIDIKVEIDTNKRTITHFLQPESMNEAVQLLRNIADDLEEDF